MFFIYNLIFFSFFAEAQATCRNVTLHGSLLEKNRQLFFVTHQNSQEEKLWEVQVKTSKQRIQLYALKNIFTEAQALLMEQKNQTKHEIIFIQNIERSATAAQFSRNAKAIALGSKAECPK